MGRPVLPETNDVIKWRKRYDEKNGVLWCPGQSTPSDKYREGWDRIFGEKGKESMGLEKH